MAVTGRITAIKDEEKDKNMEKHFTKKDCPCSRKQQDMNPCIKKTAIRLPGDEKTDSREAYSLKGNGSMPVALRPAASCKFPVFMQSLQPPPSVAMPPPCSPWNETEAVRLKGEEPAGTTSGHP